MMLLKIKDFILDKRFIWNKIDKNYQDQKISKLYIALTFDIEQVWGSKGYLDFQNAKAFIQNLDYNLNKKPATIFLQANIIKHFYNDLIKFKKKHELGLHCYQHSGLWGEETWFLNEKKLSYKEKKQALEKSLAIFKQFDLPRPKSFRAPNLIINHESLELLNDYGFEIDSSYDSFRNIARIRKIKKIWQIPVSQFGEAKIKMANFLPIRDFNILNMGNLLKIDKKVWQKNLLTYPYKHIVFMGHNWDFDKNKFTELTNFLEKNFTVNYITLMNLKNNL